ncbi:hypothetical protein HY29_06080 [Hyphomonas beringensis]|uniref:Uncharacterized protein n=1 Tax=Hyphomonas beringensis TaxID=1280946 RepID=A0A062TZG7_9PROT|nr:hypothetical protein [Hyphomonas beringensis]KCZ51432.1 hypothetical protein HY29_06080 [Hyphomonas beringensis]
MSEAADSQTIGALHKIGTHDLLSHLCDFADVVLNGFSAALQEIQPLSHDLVTMDWQIFAYFIRISGQPCLRYHEDEYPFMMNSCSS